MLAAAPLLALAGCDQVQPRSARLTPPPEPPPQFWKITATGGKAVHLCADGRLASGFTSITPEIGGRRCDQVGPVTGGPPGQNYRCRINGQEFGVATVVTGRYPNDFTAVSSVVDIDSQRSVYGRSLHFVHIGPCPAGWGVGQATDQAGQRLAAAFVVGANTVYQGQR